MTLRYIAVTRGCWLGLSARPRERRIGPRSPRSQYRTRLPHNCLAARASVLGAPCWRPGLTRRWTSLRCPRPMTARRAGAGLPAPHDELRPRRDDTTGGALVSPPYPCQGGSVSRKVRLLPRVPTTPLRELMETPRRIADRVGALRAGRRAKVDGALTTLWHPAGLCRKPVLVSSRRSFSGFR